MEQHNLALVADYFQFYLQDEAALGDLSDSWTPEAVDRLLAVAPGTVGVGTVRNSTVPVCLEVYLSEPVADAQLWDHVTECQLDVPTGRVVIAGCTDYFPSAFRISLEPGLYQVRVSYGGLSSATPDGSDGNDRYRVQLWPGTGGEPRIVKCRAP